MKSAGKNEMLTPMLRFPEFRDAPEWEEKAIGEFLVESRIKGSPGDIARKLTVKLWGNGVFGKVETITCPTPAPRALRARPSAQDSDAHNLTAPEGVDDEGAGGSSSSEFPAKSAYRRGPTFVGAGLAGRFRVPDLSPKLLGFRLHVAHAALGRCAGWAARRGQVHLHA
jgi:hypothetical protein